MRRVSAIWVAALLLTVAAAADQGGSGLTCTTCHAPDEIHDTPHGRGGLSGQCAACHGDSPAHFSVGADGVRLPVDVLYDHRTPVAAQNAVCLDCHQGNLDQAWHDSAHDQASMSCTSCHTIHQAQDPVLARTTEPQVCFDCHQPTRAELSRVSRHPVHGFAGVAAVGLTCTDCHAPHGSSTPGDLVRATENQTCYECHSEKRGPFLWEHAPVRESCGNCHAPHGSNHVDLLVARTPWLCQQCHLAQFHPSTAYSGTGVPPSGAAHSLLSRNCMNCHTQVHGSNHPSGPGQTR